MLIVRLQCASAKIPSNYGPGSGDKRVNGDLDMERGRPVSRAYINFGRLSINFGLAGNFSAAAA